MPPRKNTKDAPVDFDELLAEEPAAEEVVAGDEPDAEPELSPAQKRLAAARARAAELDALPEDQDPYRGLSAEEIKELELIEARIARADAAQAPAITIEVPELTPEQKEEQDRIVRANTERLLAAERAPVQFDNSRKGGTGEMILFHVLIDGFTAFSNVWNRGQEIEIEVGTPAYQRTFDVNGDTWLNIIDDEHAQYNLWGRRMVGPGEFRPLPGEKFEDDLVTEDARRRRTVPITAI